MDPIQAMINGMNQQWQQDRAGKQMTLGKLIERLRELPEDLAICLGNPHSYRGYYNDLAFETVPQRTVKDFLQECESCMGEVFEGYKGGDYQMGKNTPVWVSDYGTTGECLMEILDDGSFKTQEEEW